MPTEAGWLRRLETAKEEKLDRALLCALYANGFSYHLKSLGRWKPSIGLSTELGDQSPKNL